MARYTFTAVVTKTGKDERGSFEATNAFEAAATLRNRGLAPTRLEIEEPTSADAATKAKVIDGGRRSDRKRIWPAGRKVSRKSLMLFTRQLATLINAGLPLTRALEVLARQEKNLRFQTALRALSSTIGAGGNFSDGLARHPAIFDRLYLNMVKAGEAGGVLGSVLERLAQFMEKNERLKSRVKSAMIYPVIIMGVAAGILAVLMIFVVPKFEQIFTGLLKGQPLPTVTRSLLAVSHAAAGHKVVSIGVCVLGWTALGMLKRTARGRRILDLLLLRMPIVGELVLKASVARFTRTLGSLIASGVSLLEAFIITRNTAGNVHVAEALTHVHDRIKQGDTIARPLEATAIFPDMVAGMIQVGEETGALSEMLVRIADTYDEEVDAAVAGLTSVIEPIMIVFMALVVGTIVIALFLPIVSVIQHLQ